MVSAAAAAAAVAVPLTAVALAGRAPCKSKYVQVPDKRSFIDGSYLVGFGPFNNSDFGLYILYAGVGLDRVCSHSGRWPTAAVESELDQSIFAFLSL